LKTHLQEFFLAGADRIMGISQHEARALIGLYKKVGSFGRVATLGRQTLLVRRGYWRTLLRPIESAPKSAKMLEVPEGPFADDFFRLLGATEVVSFDHSDYEGASIVHDMNVPIPPQFHQSFDFVYDGGTLEHVYNFPEAIKSCVDMLKASGLFVCASPANNFMGHGFYQFSPELFFRLFSRENGFRLEQVLAFEYETGGAWYEVEDPGKLGRRAEMLGTKSRIILWVAARKLGTKSINYVLYPKQSDYVSQWEGKRQEICKNGPSIKSAGRVLMTRLEGVFPGLIDYIAGIRDSRRIKQANRKGLSSDSQAFKRIP
jgi:SAM-dependent methyltransferase